MLTKEVHRADDDRAQAATLYVGTRISGTPDDLHKTMCQDANAIFTLLRDSLPQGTMDWLLVLMLKSELFQRANLGTVSTLFCK